MSSLADELAAAFGDDENQENSLNSSNIPDQENETSKLSLSRDFQPESQDEDSVWSEICDQFDPDEETANFGTRHAFEAQGNLFDVFTLATVQPKVRFQWFPCLLDHLRPISINNSKRSIKIRRF